MAGLIFTTRTPKGTRMESPVRCTMRSPSVAPFTSMRAEMSPGPSRWMMPGEARSRTSTAFDRLAGQLEVLGEVLQLHGTESPISDVFSPAITYQSRTARPRLMSFSGR